MFCNLSTMYYVYFVLKTKRNKFNKIFISGISEIPKFVNQDDSIFRLSTNVDVFF